MSRNLSEVYPPREYTAADIGAVGLTGDQDIEGAKNFLGAVQRDGVKLEDVLPSDRMEDYDHTRFTDWLKKLHAKNVNIGFKAGTYTHGITAVASGYMGGVYSPTQNRIYLAPHAQSNQPNWHYIDCSTGAVVPYAHGATAEANGYVGGVYSPTQNRIYLVPLAQANQTNWHYINCATGAVVAYAHGATAVASGYQGGVYSPTQNRIYLVPFAQANQTNWHYIQEFSEAECPPSVAANALFNKL